MNIKEICTKRMVHGILLTIGIVGGPLMGANQPVKQGALFKRALSIKTKNARILADMREQNMYEKMLRNGKYYCECGDFRVYPELFAEHRIQCPVSNGRSLVKRKGIKRLQPSNDNGEAKRVRKSSAYPSRQHCPQSRKQTKKNIQKHDQDGQGELPGQPVAVLLPAPLAIDAPKKIAPVPAPDRFNFIPDWVSPEDMPDLGNPEDLAIDWINPAEDSNISQEYWMLRTPFLYGTSDLAE